MLRPIDFRDNRSYMPGNSRECMMALWPQDFLKSFAAQFAAGISRGLTKADMTKADMAQAGRMVAATHKTTTKTRKN